MTVPSPVVGVFVTISFGDPPSLPPVFLKLTWRRQERGMTAPPITIAIRRALRPG
jgi:hypothetical protein